MFEASCYHGQVVVSRNPTAGAPLRVGSSGFNLHQLVAMATIAGAFAVVALFNQTMTDLARSLLGLYGGMVFGGLFQVPGVLAHALLRRRWVAFTTQNLFGIVQVA